MKWIFYLLLLILAIVLESTIITLPLVLILVICLAVIMQTTAVFVFSLLAGIILDSLLFRPLGITSLFFLFVLSGIFLYQRKFEIRTPAFAALTSIGAAALYLHFLEHTHIGEQMIIAGIVALAVFWILQKVQSNI